MRLKKEFNDFDNREIEIKPAQEGFIVRYTKELNDEDIIKNNYTVYKNNAQDIKDLLFHIIEYLELNNDHIFEIKIDEEVYNNENNIRDRKKR